MFAVDPRDEPITLFVPDRGSLSTTVKPGRLVAAIAVAICLLIATYWTAVDGDHDPPAPAAPPEPVEVTRPIRQALPLGADMLAPALLSPFSPSGFRRVRTVPDDVCAAVGERLGLSAGWKRSSIEGNGWECAIGPAVIGAISEGREPSSLFVLIRGPSVDRISQVQIKVNLLGTDLENAASANVGDLLRTLSSFPGLNWPKTFQFAPLTEGSVIEAGASFRVRREYADPRRLNLTASYGRSSAQPGD